MTPQQFSIMFAVNGVGLIIVSQVVALLVEKLHRHILLIILTIIQVVGVALIILTLTFHLPLWVLLIAFFLNVCPGRQLDHLVSQWLWKNEQVAVVTHQVYLAYSIYLRWRCCTISWLKKANFNTSPYMIIISLQPFY